MPARMLERGYKILICRLLAEVFFLTRTSRNSRRRTCFACLPCGMFVQWYALENVGAVPCVGPSSIHAQLPQYVSNRHTIYEQLPQHASARHTIYIQSPQYVFMQNTNLYSQYQWAKARPERPVNTKPRASDEGAAPWVRNRMYIAPWKGKSKDKQLTFIAFALTGRTP